jgi:hypothetical protein
MFWLELGPALCNGLGIFKPFANSIPPLSAEQQKMWQ